MGESFLAHRYSLLLEYLKQVLGNNSFKENNLVYEFTLQIQQFIPILWEKLTLMALIDLDRNFNVASTRVSYRKAHIVSMFV